MGEGEGVVDEAGTAAFGKDRGTSAAGQGAHNLVHELDAFGIGDEAGGGIGSDQHAVGSGDVVRERVVGGYHGPAHGASRVAFFRGEEAEFFQAGVNSFS